MHIKNQFKRISSYKTRLIAILSIRILKYNLKKLKLGTESEIYKLYDLID